MTSASKAERLIDLVMLLLATPRPLTVAEIRERIPGYGAQSDDTFHRMFERDKAELRDLGLSLEQDEPLGGPVGYRIRARDALLEDPGLTPEEQAALALAARAWGEGAGGGDASLGMLKLAAVSGETGGGPEGWVLPRVSLTKEAAAVLDAISRRKRVSFRYRGSGGEAKDRTVEPHGLVHRGGQWYLTGYDAGAGDVRHFKLARVEGKLRVARGRAPDFDAPPAADLESPRAPWEGEGAVDARVVFAPDAAWSVERRAGVRRARERADGWAELLVPFSDAPTFAAWVAGFADRAVVLDPPELRAAVVDRLRALAERGP